MNLQKAIKKLKMDKRGIFGLDSAKQFFVVLLSTALLAFIIILVMGLLLDINILGTDSLGDNQTEILLTNVSTGVTGFFGTLTPGYTVLAVVVIILILVVLIRVVGGTGGSGRGSL